MAKSIFDFRGSSYLLAPDEEIEKLNNISSDKENRQAAYYDYLDSDQWQKLRYERLNKDNCQCVYCGSSKHLNVHHLRYKKWGTESINDLITLCEQCHEKTHQKL